MAGTHAFELLSKEQVSRLYNIMLATDKRRVLMSDRLVALVVECEPSLSDDFINRFNTWMTIWNGLTAEAGQLMEEVTEQIPANDR